MTATDFIPVVIVAVIPTAAFIHHRLSGLAQPLRLELAEKGERLLASPDLPKEIRDQVSFMLDTAFGMRALMVGAVIAFPFVALGVFAFRRDILARSLRDLTALTPAQYAQFYEVFRLHDRITTANHPTLQILLEFELLVVAAIILFFIAVAKLPLPSKLDKAIVLNILEMGESRLLNRRSKTHATSAA